MKTIVALSFVALALGGCTFDQTLADLQTSAPVIRETVNSIVCIGTPIATSVAGVIEAGVAPGLVPLNNIATAGGQVACSRLSTPVVAQ